MRGADGLLGWLRGLPRSVVLTGCGVLLALTQTVLGLLAAPTWSRVAAAFLVAAIALASEADKYHAKRVEKAAAEQREREAKAAAERDWLRRAQEWLRFWPAPAADRADLAGLGVRPVLTMVGGEAGDPGDYVARDVDGRAADRLRAHGRVLLVGEPASGVTRTAAELVRADRPVRHVLAPRPPDGLRRSVDELEVLDRLPAAARLIVWLDRIDDHLPDGVTVPLLRRCLDASPGSRIVATISSTGYARWKGEHPELAGYLGEPVRVKRLPSTRERAAAESLYPGIDFAHGIAAAFTGTASLLDRLTGGNTDCSFESPGDDCGLSRLLVEVAIGWRSTGTTRPLTRQRAARLAGDRLPNHTEETHVAACLVWAARPVREGVGLLTVEEGDPDGAVRAHAGLADVVSAESEPDVGVWAAALDDAADAGDSDAVGRVGYTAHTSRLAGVARQAWDRIGDLDEPAAGWLKRAEHYSDSTHDPRGRLAPLERLLTLTEKKQGPDHPEIAATLVNLGVAWFELGEPARARDLYQRALTILERAYGPDHPEIATTLGNLGGAWFELGEPGRARDLFQRALTILEREHGPDHPEIATTLGNLGSAWLELGEPGRARDLFQRALTIQEREYGPDHPKVAAPLGNLGGAWLELGEPGKARDLYQRALTIEEREYGPDHPKVAAPLGNLGGAWFALGEPARARDLLERALTILEREYGPDHPEVAATLVGLGNAWGGLGEPGRARDLYQRALTIREREYGPDHPKVATALGSLGNAWAGLGEPGRARDLYQRALTIQERAYGPDHPEIAATLGNLGSAWAKLGEPGTARDLHLRGLKIQRHHYPSGHPLTRHLTRNLRKVAPDLVVLDNGEVVGETARRTPDTSSSEPLPGHREGVGNE